MKNYIKKLLKENLDKLITCKKCGWHWKDSESDKDDLYVCHKCGFDNSNETNEGKVLNYLKDVDPIKDTDKIRVYHGFYSVADAIVALTHGLSGQVRASRIYSYEYGNNPKGLFVSSDFNTVKKNFAGSGIIIEFETFASNLEAPVWAGQDNFFVQGQYTKSFKSPEERDAETLRKREKYKTDDPEGKYFKHRISKSDRPELGQSLYDNVERQALFVGNLNPNEIKNVWFNEGRYFRNTTIEPWKRYSRKDFLRKFGETLMKDTKNSDKYHNAQSKIFKPNDDLTIDKLKTKAAEESWNYNDLIKVLKRDTYYQNLFLFPKQIKQFKMLFPDNNEEDVD